MWNRDKDRNRDGRRDDGILSGFRWEEYSPLYSCCTRDGLYEVKNQCRFVPLHEKRRCFCIAFKVKKLMCQLPIKVSARSRPPTFLQFTPHREAYTSVGNSCRFANILRKHSRLFLLSLPISFGRQNKTFDWREYDRHHTHGTSCNQDNRNRSRSD